MNFIEELIWRGLVKDVTDIDGLKKHLSTSRVVYCGFDPTASSLHIGHLQQLILLMRYSLAGHKPIVLIGGVTGMIGDPRPTTERSLQSLDVIEKNVESLAVQIKGIVGSHCVVDNNANWLKPLSMISLLRDYGKYFNISQMIAKDIISSRLNKGISFTEFTYTILQAIDWLELFKRYNCTVQIGGSDQWGNLLSGYELMRKMPDLEADVYGITSPLITKSDGSKFGKSEGENIWLDSNLTSPYTFYQYLLNSADADIEELLKRLSLQSVEFIQDLMEKHQQAPHLRVAQKHLASELTQLVFGDNGLESALRITDALFNSNYTQLSAFELSIAFKDATMVTINQDANLVDVLVDNKLISSKREARQLINSGSILVNSVKVDNIDYVLLKDNAIDSQYSIIRKGKKTYYLIKHE